MTPKMLKLYGVIGGFILLFLATTQFLRSYQEGEPKWNYVFMIFGMALILLYSLFNFSKSIKKRNKKK